ncbi:hypothetical protein [Methylorubrum podarium]|jgi:hypothetical protein|uniref:hypothetical protein n=1 Tax=Methylorubrum podarium TaxID=200476 RepID=UPI001EE2983E|nr:hypothetical protein [Methylorubrum podarium]GJE72171.1 hypothetical protein CHKEEEPN_3725 [Methylorubrum podarium]
MVLFRPRTALLAAVLLSPGSLHAQGEAACARDVLVAGSMQRQAIEQLEGGGDDEASLCRVWRRHVETMRRIAGVYGRCLSGPERTERLSQVQGSEKEFAGLVRSRCRGM